MTERRIKVPIEQAVRRIRNADVLLFRPTTREGWCIWGLGRTEYSHAALAYWSTTSDGKRRLKVIEQIQPEGREVSFLQYVGACPSGVVDVYRLRPGVKCDFNGVVQWALDHVPGTPYDYRGLRKSLKTHLAFWRWFYRPSPDDEADGTSILYCSAAVAKEYRLGGGCDLVNNRADRDTEPGDLATTGLLLYRFTIVHSNQGDEK